MAIVDTLGSASTNHSHRWSWILIDGSGTSQWFMDIRSDICRIANIQRSQLELTLLWSAGGTATERFGFVRKT
jgi:hypothetical protein